MMGTTLLGCEEAFSEVATGRGLLTVITEKIVGFFFVCCFVSRNIFRCICLYLKSCGVVHRVIMIAPFSFFPAIGLLREVYILLIAYITIDSIELRRQRVPEKKKISQRASCQYLLEEDCGNCKRRYAMRLPCRAPPFCFTADSSFIIPPAKSGFVVLPKSINCQFLSSVFFRMKPERG